METKEGMGPKRKHQNHSSSTPGNKGNYRHQSCRNLSADKESSEPKPERERGFKQIVRQKSHFQEQIIPCRNFETPSASNEIGKRKKKYC